MDYRTMETGDADETVTTVELRCSGHVRRAVGFGKTEYRFDGRRLRDLLEEVFATYDVRDLIIAETEADATTRGWAPSPDSLPGRWKKNPPGDQTRRYARVLVNGTFNEHLDGLDTVLEDGDRVSLLYPFVYCV
ncbi:MAG: MoaD/ThiS family protein [Halanaeroarchaeum sp.]